jgi:ABC-type antimicrobial peptide transport system permease subunit
MTLFGSGALLLALIGIYGLVSFAVVQRKQEIGIRIALGADAATVRRLIVREAVGPAAAGLALGLCAGIAGSLAFGVICMKSRRSIR